jgi:hypothetical protein
VTPVRVHRREDSTVDADAGVASGDDDDRFAEKLAVALIQVDGRQFLQADPDPDAERAAAPT